MERPPRSRIRAYSWLVQPGRTGLPIPGFDNQQGWTAPAYPLAYPTSCLPNIRGRTVYGSNNNLESLDRRSRFRLFSVLLLMSLLSFAMLGVRQVNAGVKSLTPHAPILIDGPGNFTASNGVTGGSGTKNNPYIIQGWSIDARTANGIEIRDIVSF